MSGARTLLAVALTAAALVTVPSTAAADEGLNFTESGGCATAGYRPPLAHRSGPLPRSHRVYGPWADLYGRNYDQVAGQMVDWVVPMSGGRTVKVHSRALPAYRRVADNLAAAAASGLRYDVTAAFGWTWRSVVGGSERMSFHAFGTATDINPAANPYLPQSGAEAVTDMPDWYVAAWVDAGFCWGGSWVSIKDAMHFSWMGPAATPGYGPAPIPQPPLTAAAAFTRPAFTGALGLDPAAGWTLALADRNRDGAPDVYGVRWLGDGMVRVEVLGAVSGFATVGLRRHVEVGGGPTTHDLALADYDGDNWADLWVTERASGLTTIYADGGDLDDPFAEALVTVSLPPGSKPLVGDYDRDLATDLFVVDEAGVRVMAGPGFAAELARFTATIPPGEVLVGDHDLDGIPDLYLAGTDAVQVHTAASGYAAGPVLPLPAAVGTFLGDYDGDGRDDLFRLTEGLALTVLLGGERNEGADLTSWFVHPDLDPWDAGPECLGSEPCDQVGYVSDGAEFNLKEDLSSAGADHEFHFGIPGDVPLVGDWDCDGIDTPGMYRPSNGFAYLAEASATRLADAEFFFGRSGDIPLAGDWDGDGCDTLAIYRPLEGRVFVSNQLGTRPADVSYFFGVPGDRPFQGDFDGDGLDEVGLYRQSSGFVYFRWEHAGGPADAEFFYGAPGDAIVAGDWDGDGTDTLATFRPDEGRWYFSLANRQGVADHVIGFGPEEDVAAVAGNFGDLDYD